MAGIYISGMEMPLEGTFNIVHIHSDGRVSLPYWGKGMQIVQDITAAHIPPHGRLGDLDRILEIIDGIWDCNDMTFKPNDHCCDVPKDCHGCKWAETKRAIREIVANAPTIIPADRRERDV